MSVGGEPENTNEPPPHRGFSRRFLPHVLAGAGLAAAGVGAGIQIERHTNQPPQIDDKDKFVRIGAKTEIGFQYPGDQILIENVLRDITTPNSQIKFNKDTGELRVYDQNGTIALEAPLSRDGMALERVVIMQAPWTHGLTFQYDFEPKPDGRRPHFSVIIRRKFGEGNLTLDSWEWVSESR